MSGEQFCYGGLVQDLILPGSEGELFHIVREFVAIAVVEISPLCRDLDLTLELAGNGAGHTLGIHHLDEEDPGDQQEPAGQ